MKSITKLLNGYFRRLNRLGRYQKLSENKDGTAYFAPLQSIGIFYRRNINGTYC